MSEPRAVGIDLGTTHSAVAVVDPSGRTSMVPNAEGDILTPSVVMFDDDEVVVGKEARRVTTVHPDHVAEWVKRDVGSPTYSRPIRGEYLPPEVIQACILRRLKDDILSRHGREGKVVITVPAYFDEPRRNSTADAGEMAGLDVLDIVNEPTAAAMAFGEIHGYLDAGGEPRDEMVVLVYDLGGGTFDVTLLRLAPGDVRTLATDGDVQLGGHDWDLRLLDHAADAFVQAHGLDPRDDPASLNRLYNSVIDAKHTLSARKRATIEVDDAGRTGEVDVTREQFEDLTADLLERTAYTTRQLLSESGLAWSDVSRLLLVGGSTRMPMVSNMLTAMTGIEPDHSVNPDEAVARGAALYASYLLARQSGGAGPSFDVTNVNAHSLGIEGIEPETMRKKNVVLIRRNTQLPARFTEKFVTKTDNQRSIVIRVLEGESAVPDECGTIGKTVLRNLPPDLPQGWPVEVTFEYGSNGRLSVRAKVPGTHSEVAMDIQREVGMSREGMSGWSQAVIQQSGFEAFEKLVDAALHETTPAAETPFSTGLLPPEGMPETAAPAEAPPLPDQPAPAADRDFPSGKDGPSAASTTPIEDDPMEPAAQPDRARRKRRIPRWLITVAGFLVSSIIGILVGYLVVSSLFPDHGLPRFW